MQMFSAKPKFDLAAHLSKPASPQEIQRAKAWRAQREALLARYKPRTGQKDVNETLQEV